MSLYRGYKNYNKKSKRKHLHGLQMVIFVGVLFALYINTKHPELFQSVATQTETTIEGQVVSDTSLEAVTLERVVDGDTIVVLTEDGTEEKVRLLEVNTPESVHSDSSKNNEYGDMASEWTKSMLNGYDTLYLAYDKEREDQYGRTLAYVWLSNSVNANNEEDIRNFCLNAMLLSNGMAECVIYEPNDYYEDLFQSLESEAISNQIGLWQYDEYHQIVGK